jgi:hypothetical protein
MAGVKGRELFKKLNVLPDANEFLLSLLSFIVDNMKEFETNSAIYISVSSVTAFSTE